MAPSPTQLLEQRETLPLRRRRGFWTVQAVVEVLLAGVAVVLNLASFPTLVILALAGISLALRREGLSVLRLHYRTLWASILAHGLWNTLGIVGFFLVRPVNGFW